MNLKAKEQQDILLTLVKIVMVSLVLSYSISFLFVRTHISGNSMYPTLHDGDTVIISKLPILLGNYGYGDIVVFEVDDETSYVKRVIGLPNDLIKIENDKLFVNGVEVKEYYLNDSYIKDYERMTTKEFNGQFSSSMLDELKVPEDYVFVLGDNRPISKDSRDSTVGYVKKNKIQGKVIRVLSSK